MMDKLIALTGSATEIYQKKIKPVFDADSV